MADILRSHRHLTRRTILGTGAAAAGLALAGPAWLGRGPARAFAQSATPAAGGDAATTLTEAWAYGYPFLSVDRTRAKATNTVKPDEFQAPLNQLAKLRQFPNADFTAVVAPNVDTLYSSVFYDLSKEPMVFQWPDMGDRFFMFPFLNAWTDAIASYGSRTTGQEGKTLVISGPGWDGEVPAGVSLPDDVLGLRADTNLVWMIGRMYCSGTPEDIDAVHVLQDQLKLVPLSQWGTDYVAPDGTVDPAVDMTTPPVDQVNAMDPVAFMDRLAHLMPANPPMPADAPLLARMADLGIVAGQPFDGSTLDAAAKTALADVPKQVLTRLPEAAARLARDDNGWLVSNTVGDYGTDYYLRAYVAMIGLGANLAADAMYPNAFTDSDGRPLDASSNYVVSFHSEPPVKGFWSLTAYTKDRFLVANPLNRFAIRGVDPVVRNADGGFDLYLQATSPGADKEANWLPVPPSGPFSMTLRLYWPDESALDGTWPWPLITKAS